jgi:DNA-directed RNA polymerase specialized sigma24 family protein
MKSGRLEGTPKTEDRSFRLDFTDRLIGEIDRSVRTILARKFPRLPACDREDVLQEVRAKIWKMQAGGKKIDRLESYLWKVVFTTTLSVMGGRFKEVSLDALGGDKAMRLPSGLVVGPDTGEMERRELVSRLVARLPLKRRLVVKHHLAGRSLEETAEALGWTLPKVRHLFYRSIAELQKLAAGTKSPAGRPRKRKMDEGKKRERLPVSEPGSAGKIPTE